MPYLEEWPRTSQCLNRLALLHWSGVDGSLKVLNYLVRPHYRLAAKYAQEYPQYVPSLLIFVRYEYLTVLTQILFLADSFVVHITKKKYPAEYYCVIHTPLRWTEQAVFDIRMSVHHIHHSGGQSRLCLILVCPCIIYTTQVDRAGCI